MNRRTAIKTVARGVATLLVAVTVGCGSQGSDEPVSYTAEDLVSGNDVSVASLRGRPALLVSWTTWCTECDEELTGLQQFAESNAAADISIVAVNLDASDVTDEINAKIADHGLTTATWRDRRNDFKRVFGTLGVPTTVLLDAGGVVVGLFPGTVDFEDREILDALERVHQTR